MYWYVHVHVEQKKNSVFFFSPLSSPLDKHADVIVTQFLVMHNEADRIERDAIGKSTPKRF